MDKVALNLPWLRASLAETAKVDEICRRLLGISERVYGPGKKDHSRDIRLHIMRNDFMLESTVGSSGFAGRQIELNMIAASFSTHCADLTEVHRYALVKYIPRLRPDCDAQDVHEALQQALPRSPNTDGIAAALAQAQRVYANRWKPTGKPRVVLFISSEKENNELDHRKLEISLFKNHKVLTVRRSLAALSAQCSTLLAPLEPAGFDGAAAADGSRGPQALLVDGHEVAVAYFREGYWPGQFCPAEECWTARETIEISEAVKCPSAPAQLAGMKKVQQLLSQAHELRRFAPDGVGQRLRRCFARQEDPSAESEEAKQAVRAAKDDPASWVMKPQVEGSGDLLFGVDIPKTLGAKSRDELAEFILMERISPPVVPSAVLRAEPSRRAEPVVRRSVSELGIFGAFLADGTEVLQNVALGPLLRSKAKDTSQGGVFVGNAVVDVPLLVPAQRFWSQVERCI
ncbi:unnamed protein product [Prorocentrum cordatum]|uniref:Glutathione synthetase n=1 Tax=Prorocentrum cordatum TaxID=2364126 RepID=A0ABN9ULX9_9DINO|nr:unnamed protein product [Polarella glacialis]